MIRFAEVSYEAEESSGMASVQLVKEGENERDVSVMVALDTLNTEAIGTFLCKALYSQYRQGLATPPSYTIPYTTYLAGVLISLVVAWLSPFGGHFILVSASLTSSVS